jgi:hypothetical protein
MKSCFAFLINQFLVDVINDGCTINKILLTETSATELELVATYCCESQ